MQIIKTVTTPDFREETTVFYNGKTYLREVAGLLYWFVKDDKWNFIKDYKIKNKLEEEFKLAIIKEEFFLKRQKKLERIINDNIF